MLALSPGPPERGYGSRSPSRRQAYRSVLPRSSVGGPPPGRRECCTRPVPRPVRDDRRLSLALRPGGDVDRDQGGGPVFVPVSTWPRECSSSGSPGILTRTSNCSESADVKSTSLIFFR